MLQHQTTLSNLGVRAMMALITRTATVLLAHDRLGTAAASRSTASEEMGSSDHNEPIVLTTMGG